MSITSLIDVIFLLLLFFMLASTFSKFAELEVSNGGSVGMVSAEPSQVMRLTIDERSLSLDGRNFSVSELAQVVTKKLPSTPVLNLQVTEQTTSQRLTDILTLLEPVDGLQVTMVAGS